MKRTIEIIRNSDGSVMISPPLAHETLPVAFIHITVDSTLWELCVPVPTAIIEDSDALVAHLTAYAQYVGLSTTVYN